MDITLGTRDAAPKLTKAQALAAFAFNKHEAKQHVWWMYCFIAGSLGLCFLARSVMLLDSWIWARTIRRAGGHGERGYDLGGEHSLTSPFRDVREKALTIPVWQRLVRASVAFVRKVSP